MKNAFLAFVLITLFSCSEDNILQPVQEDTNDLQTIIQNTFGDRVDFTNLENYANQTIPSYITKDNTNGNTITDEKATLGRILFYDKNLSTDNTVSCAGCHHWCW